MKRSTHLRVYRSLFIVHGGSVATESPYSANLAHSPYGAPYSGKGR
ncbi:MAG: hypothetical protein GY820_03530 [Gammaproteobacteria bacterium]|nr:hypothetical protein [Gammaproteobacteria bacterium]